MKSALPILDALRAATAEDHQRLESATLGDRIMDGSLSLPEYRRILEWQRRSHALLEPSVADFAAGEYAYRRRFPAPAGAPPPEKVDRATVIGIIYVLEGSSLGGSLIYRKLQDNPALASAAPFSFYRDQADWGLQQWRSFLAYLRQATFTEEEIERATASARDAFGRFTTEWRGVA
ncbi:biliverdin-producing heme oxygenase [Lewinella sp. IMCC34183]|uniref:biliverdin-producing heme oxygenase n=1 Tax=Lewinella sp. IMCC34183 TaxID=2248762 RepID=UPI000E25F95C|nr:biliverdin-producing heme oxygenase [Lewinella sp. IMCC34183]